MRRMLTTLLLLGALCADAARAQEARQPLAQAEALLDAFYSWDAQALASEVEPSADADRLLYYQRWAMAAHYEVTLRRPCVRRPKGDIECRITVTDDFGSTLGYIATDTFVMTPGAERIAAVSFAGDDPPVFEELFAWIRTQQPWVLDGPCENLFAGGRTPAECARAVVAAAQQFMQQFVQQREHAPAASEQNRSRAGE